MGGIYAEDFRVNSQDLISYHLITKKIHTPSLPNFDLTTSFRLFIDPPNHVDPQGWVVS